MDPPEEDEGNPPAAVVNAEMEVNPSVEAPAAIAPAIAPKISNSDDQDCPWLPFLNAEGKIHLPPPLDIISKLAKIVVDPDNGRFSEVTSTLLTTALLDVWKELVPRFYVLKDNQDCLDPFNNKKILEDHLIENLTCLLTDGVGSSGLNEFLKVTDPPATICGKVFQIGEATYCCRDCGLDPTCVLCADCFKASQHKHHRYKIAASGGGGYCDCGDTEAWKSFVHCDNHDPSSHAMNHKTPSEPGEDDPFESRAKAICYAVISYAYRLTVALEEATRLPTFLTPSASPDDDAQFCTVLFNDETHTFDVVIQTLTRALGCSKKVAIEYATIIDREGRSIVKVNKFSPCNQVATMIQRQTARNRENALKVIVMHSQVVAHQTFALRLLQWLESLCARNETVRRCVALILTSINTSTPTQGRESKYTWCQGIMLNDTQLWKTARTCWHRLLISSLLKDYEFKKLFAKYFTKHYPELMKDFIQDDHDHSFSITSLSVQVFTVPSLAHYLVEEQEVLFTIMRTLLSECEQRLNSKRKLEFNRESMVNNIFKRANYAIIDLKYILSSIPNGWSTKMLKNVSQAIESFLKLLSYMQEMDAVTRQVGQHMEYEPEWESAFNLHIKLQPVMQLSLEWCGANIHVFIRAYRCCLQHLLKTYNELGDSTVTLELANHSATCYLYDVATQPVSVHLPLTRYFAGLYLYLEKFGLDFDSHHLNLTSSDKPPPAMLMEAALRTQVLIAQVNSQMWKRNGYALLNQLYFYHNVRCRTDMLDKDIIALQIGASLIESNEFILHVLNRFGLYAWTDSSFEDKALKPQGPEEELSKYLPSLADEFFGLIITIFSARYQVGVGQVSKHDCVKKEVIQQLCIEPMTHSTLNKALVENVNFETGLENVIRDVAILKEPTKQRTSVVYELKPEFYESYDVYHYHYSREDMSKAEEKQRERKRLAKESEFFPPPKLPRFTPQFTMVINLLQCDVLLHLISLVLTRSIPKTGRISSSSESLVRKVLHLIGHGLNEELSRNEQEGENFFQFSEAAKKWKILDLLDELLRESSCAHYHNMIKWIKKQLNKIRPQEEELPESAEPVEVQQNEEEEKKRRAERMREAKEKMMASMAAAQQKFMAVNKELFVDETAEEVMNENEMETAPSETIAIGPNKTQISIPDEKFVCILCQEEQLLAVGAKRFVLASFVQRSTVLSEYRAKLLEEAEADQELQSNSIPYLERTNPLYLRADLMSGPVVTTCGHIMHESCWSSHFETVFNKERRRPYRLRHPVSFDVEKNEWLCPMCECICNAALPMSPALPKLYDSEGEPVSVNFDTWVVGLQHVLSTKSVADAEKLSAPEDVQTYFNDNALSDNPLKHLKCAGLEKVVEELGDLGSRFGLLYPSRRIDLGSLANRWLSNGIQSRLTNFMQLTFTVGLDQDIVKDDDFRVALLMWQALTFTVISAEAYHRDQMIPFFGEDVPIRKSVGLKYLTRACAIACDRKGWLSNLRTFTLRILTNLLHNPGKETSLVECDAFGLLVTLTFSMPALFGTEVPPEAEMEGEAAQPDPNNEPSTTTRNPPSGSTVDHHILRLVFMYHISQILVQNDFTDCVRIETESKSEDGSEPMDTATGLGNPTDPVQRPTFVPRKQCIFGEVWRVAGRDHLPWQEMEKVNCEAVWNKICDASVPFLRCCAKLYENVTGIVPPASLEHPMSTFENLLKYLDLPCTFEELFDSPFSWQIPYKWASHPSVSKIVSCPGPPNTEFPAIRTERSKSLPSIVPVQYPGKMRNLVNLPDDYTELINMVSNFTCKNSTSVDSRVPTMCLICGEILCSQSYCCQKELKRNSVGPCIYHANFCGGGYGIFLRIRDCKLFFTGGRNRGCYQMPPYLDEYGETDQGLRRGNPLTLSKEKYEVFRKIWLQHGIPEEIARTTEHTSTMIHTEWQFL